MIETRIAKELPHIQHWLEVAASIIAKRKAAYDADEVAQEAGDSLMIKIGEAAKTLAIRGLDAPSPRRSPFMLGTVIMPTDPDVAMRHVLSSMPKRWLAQHEEAKAHAASLKALTAAAAPARRGRRRRLRHRGAESDQRR